MCGATQKKIKNKLPSSVCLGRCAVLGAPCFASAGYQRIWQPTQIVLSPSDIVMRNDENNKAKSSLVSGGLKG